MDNDLLQYKGLKLCRLLAGREWLQYETQIHCRFVHLCRLFHLTHKHILDKYSAQITIWLFFYCCTHSFSLPFLLLPLLPLPPSLMSSPLSSHLSLPPSLFLWLFVVPPCLSFFPFPPTSSPQSAPIISLSSVIYIIHRFHFLQRCIFPWQRKRTTSLLRTNFLGRTPTLLSLRLYWWSLSR